MLTPISIFMQQMARTPLCFAEGAEDGFGKYVFRKTDRDGMDTWALYLTYLSISFKDNHSLQYVWNLIMVILTIMFPFASQNMWDYLITVSLVVLVPVIFFVEAPQVVLSFGRFIHIRDSDFSAIIESPPVNPTGVV
jgi:hypothetical protein